MFTEEIVSVRELVEFLLRSGDLDNRTGGGTFDMLEGSRIHRKIQDAAGEDYASEVYETRHVWMVLKSRMEEYMGRALRSALDAAEKKDEPVLLLKSRSETLRIPLGEILYLSRVGRKAQIVTRTGVFYSSRRPAELLSGDLAAGFVRCHQGYWVNEAGIVGLERDTFLLEDGSRIPISRSYRDASRGRFFARYR